MANTTSIASLTTATWWIPSINLILQFVISHQKRDKLQKVSPRRADVCEDESGYVVPPLRLAAPYTAFKVHTATSTPQMTNANTMQGADDRSNMNTTLETGQVDHTELAEIYLSNQGHGGMFYEISLPRMVSNVKGASMNSHVLPTSSQTKCADIKSRDKTPLEPHAYEEIGIDEGNTFDKCNHGSKPQTPHYIYCSMTDDLTSQTPVIEDGVDEYGYEIPMVIEESSNEAGYGETIVAAK